MTEADAEVLEAMRVYGGSFMQALASAAQCADEENFRRIKETWPEEWIRYSELVRLGRRVV